MSMLKDLVREQFMWLIEDHGEEFAIETVFNDQSFLLSEYRPEEVADVIELLADVEYTCAMTIIDNRLLDLFIEVCNEYQAANAEVQGD